LIYIIIYVTFKSQQHLLRKSSEYVIESTIPLPNLYISYPE